MTNQRPTDEFRAAAAAVAAKEIQNLRESDTNKDGKLTGRELNNAFRPTENGTGTEPLRGELNLATLQPLFEQMYYEFAIQSDTRNDSAGLQKLSTAEKCDIIKRLNARGTSDHSMWRYTNQSVIDTYRSALGLPLEMDAQAARERASARNDESQGTLTLDFKRDLSVCNVAAQTPPPPLPPPVVRLAPPPPPQPEWQCSRPNVPFDANTYEKPQCQYLPNGNTQNKSQTQQR